MGKQVFKRKNGDTMTFVDILMLPENTKQQVIDKEMTEQEYANFESWMDARLDAQNKRLQEKTALLKAKAEEYVSFAEQGKLIPDAKFIQANIIDNPVFDESLKNRARKFVK